MPFGLKPFYSIKVLKEGGGTISDAEVQILGGTGYKLPSDAEWTWGCAAGAKTNYHFGDEEKDLPTYAWFLANSSDRPHQVGEKLSNQFGLLDIHGNVHEWNEDHLISKDGSPSRTNRGGTFHHPASTGRVGTRPLSPPWYRTSHIGLRIARAATVEATPPPLAKAPFDATQAKAHQEAWAKYLGTTVETVNSVGAKMILIPPGEFLMGSTDEQVAAALKVAEEIKSGSTIIRSIEKAESPQHKVIITKPLLMGTTEVTLSQFKKFTAATSYQTEAEKKELKAKASPPTATTPGQSPPQNLAIAALGELRGKFKLDLFKSVPKVRGLDPQIARTAKLVRLSERLDTPVSELAYGEKRRLEIGLALATSPSLLLLDEPLAGMSPQERVETVALLKSIAAGRTMIVIDHDMDAMFELVERITVLQEGRVLVEGTPDEIRNNAAVQEAYLGGIHEEAGSA